MPTDAKLKKRFKRALEGNSKVKQLKKKKEKKESKKRNKRKPDGLPPGRWINLDDLPDFLPLGIKSTKQHRLDHRDRGRQQ